MADRNSDQKAKEIEVLREFISVCQASSKLKLVYWFVGHSSKTVLFT